MGIDLCALRKPIIQYGTRNDSDTNEDNYIQIDSYQIWSDWRNSDVNSWPKPLQHFWWKIHDSDSAHYYAKTIRKYYPFDIELLRFANWLTKFDKDVIFQLSI